MVTTFQGLPRAGILGLGHPIQQRPNQVLEDNTSHNAVRPRTGSPQTLHQAPASKASKNLRKAAPPRTAHEAVPNVSSHALVTPNTPSGHSGAPSISTPRSVMGSDLSKIPSKELDSFIQDHLRPSPQFQQQVRKAIDAILRCLREKCVYKASRVSKVSPNSKVPLGCPREPQWAGRQQRRRGPGKLDVTGGALCCLGVDRQMILSLKVESHPNLGRECCKSKLH